MALPSRVAISSADSPPCRSGDRGIDRLELDSRSAVPIAKLGGCSCRTCGHCKVTVQQLPAVQSGSTAVRLERPLFLAGVGDNLGHGFTRSDPERPGCQVLVPLNHGLYGRRLHDSRCPP